MGLHKVLKIVAIVLGLIGVVMAGMAWSQGEDASDGLLTSYIYLAYITLALVLVMVLIFVLKGLASGNAKNTLIGVAAFIVIAAISYVLATGEETVTNTGDVVSANTVKWVGAGLNMFYIVAAIAIVLMIVAGAKKLVK